MFDIFLAVTYLERKWEVFEEKFYFPQIFKVLEGFFYLALVMTSLSATDKNKPIIILTYITPCSSPLIAFITLRPWLLFSLNIKTTWALFFLNQVLIRLSLVFYMGAILFSL